MSDIHLELGRSIRFVDGAPDVTGLYCDEIPDAEGDVYMQRFHLKYVHNQSIRFHHILASDPVPQLHDHPWDYTTFLASGGYTEITPDGETYYEAPCVLVRKAEQPHRLILAAPVWTYIVTGQVRRTWGYQTEHGWVSYRKHAASEFAPCGKAPEPSLGGRPW